MFTKITVSFSLCSLILWDNSNMEPSVGGIFLICNTNLTAEPDLTTSWNEMRISGPIQKWDSLLHAVYESELSFPFGFFQFPAWGILHSSTLSAGVCFSPNVSKTVSTQCLPVDSVCNGCRPGTVTPHNPAELPGGPTCLAQLLLLCERGLLVGYKYCKTNSSCFSLFWVEHYWFIFFYFGQVNIFLSNFNSISLWPGQQLVSNLLFPPDNHNSNVLQ